MQTNMPLTLNDAKMDSLLNGKMMK